MKSTLILFVAVLLTGCAAPTWVSAMYDHNDPCQMRAELNRPEGYQRPDWCGASRGKTYIYNTNNQRVGYIKQ